MGVNYSLIKTNVGYIDKEVLIDLKKIKLRDIKVKLINKEIF
jgi:hypothetical protein